MNIPADVAIRNIESAYNAGLIRRETAAWLLSMQRPGVMVKADEDETLGSGHVSRIDRNRGEVTITLASLTDVVNFELCQDIALSFAEKPRVTAGYVGPVMAAKERVCSTCSKTCDVGVACWWCGNE